MRRLSEHFKALPARARHAENERKGEQLRAKEAQARAAAAPSRSAESEALTTTASSDSSFEQSWEHRRTHPLSAPAAAQGLRKPPPLKTSKAPYIPPAERRRRQAQQEAAASEVERTLGRSERLPQAAVAAAAGAAAQAVSGSDSGGGESLQHRFDALPPELQERPAATARVSDGLQVEHFFVDRSIAVSEKHLQKFMPQDTLESLDLGWCRAIRLQGRAPRPVAGGRGWALEAEQRGQFMAELQSQSGGWVLSRGGRWVKLLAPGAIAVAPMLFVSLDSLRVKREPPALSLCCAELRLSQADFARLAEREQEASASAEASLRDSNEADWLTRAFRDDGESEGGGGQEREHGGGLVRDTGMCLDAELDEADAQLVSRLDGLRQSSTIHSPASCARRAVLALPRRRAKSSGWAAPPPASPDKPGFQPDFLSLLSSADVDAFRCLKGAIVGSVAGSGTGTDSHNNGACTPWGEQGWGGLARSCKLMAQEFAEELSAWKSKGERRFNHCSPERCGSVEVHKDPCCAFSTQFLLFILQSNQVYLSFHSEWKTLLEGARGEQVRAHSGAKLQLSANAPNVYEVRAHIRSLPGASHK